MDPSARENYLTAQVLTATPQKLQLMLIDGAIRYVNQARSHWLAHRDDQAMESLIRCRQIVSELIASVKPDGDDLARRVRSVYAFMFRALTEAQLRRDETKLDEVLSLLQIEQETWRQVCEKLGTTQSTHRPGVDSSFSDASFASDRFAPSTVALPGKAANPPIVAADDYDLPPAGGFSFQA